MHNEEPEGQGQDPGEAEGPEWMQRRRSPQISPKGERGAGEKREPWNW